MRTNPSRQDLPANEYLLASPPDRELGVSMLWVVVPIMLLTLTASLAYASSFKGIFLFDDLNEIFNRPEVAKLSWASIGLNFDRGWGHIMGAHANRPTVNFTLAVNGSLAPEPVGQDKVGYPLLDSFGYHLMNLIIHILTAIVLYGVLRRTLRSRRLVDTFGKHADILSLIVALIWVAHPIQTESVTYIIQRAESMMSLFILLTVYCTIMASRETQWRQHVWAALAVISCALGMGCKQVMVVTPLLVIIYDRIFIAESWKEIFRRRWGLYAGLLASEAVLLYTTVFVPSVGESNAGFGNTKISALTYALTQFGVIMYYIRLTFWPSPLCLHHEWTAATTVMTWLPWAIMVLGLLGLTVLALIRRPALGFLGVWFFLILAPSSSILPLRDLVFEHRMYLPIASIIILVVLGAYLLIGALQSRMGGTTRVPAIVGAVAVMAIVVALSVATYQRNFTYYSFSAMWKDVIDQYPDDPRGQNNYGVSIASEQNQVEESLKHYLRAIELDPDYTDAFGNLGGWYQQRAHRFYMEADAATAQANKCLQANQPQEAKKYEALADQCRASAAADIDTAMKYHREALRTSPRYIKSWLQVTGIPWDIGHSDEAIQEAYNWIKTDPNTPSPYMRAIDFLMGRQKALEADKKPDEAAKKLDEAEKVAKMWIAADMLPHEKSLAWSKLGIIYRDRVPSNPAEAKKCFNEALQLAKDNSEALYSLGQLLYAEGNPDGLPKMIQALNLGTQPWDRYAHVGLALFDRGDFQSSVRYLSAAVNHQMQQERSPNPDLRFKLGMAFEQYGKPQEAYQCYAVTAQIYQSIAQQAKPDSPEALAAAQNAKGASAAAQRLNPQR